ncbi:unnamed protein product [Urochloa humidicola]
MWNPSPLPSIILKPVSLPHLSSPPPRREGWIVRSPVSGPRVFGVRSHRGRGPCRGSDTCWERQRCRRGCWHRIQRTDAVGNIGAGLSPWQGATKPGLAGGGHRDGVAGSGPCPLPKHILSQNQYAVQFHQGVRGSVQDPALCMTGRSRQPPQRLWSVAEEETSITILVLHFIVLK